MITLAVPCPYSAPFPTDSSWVRELCAALAESALKSIESGDPITITVTDATVTELRLRSIATRLESFERAAEMLR